MDQLLRKATQASEKSAKKHRELRHDSEAGRHHVNLHVQQVLSDILEPLATTNYKYLLEADASPLVSPNDGDEHGDDDAATESEEEDKLFPQAEYVFMVGGQPIFAWEYLGEEWSAWVTRLHSLIGASEAPPGIITPLRPWQLSGAEKLLLLAHSTFRGGILADEMGLGKTLTIIATCERLKSTPGSFNLVVCLKSCVHQWAEELLYNFEPASRPQVKVLADPATSVNELLDEEVDYVICTYQWVRHRWADLERITQAFENLPRGTVGAATRAVRSMPDQYIFRRRPTAALYSDVYNQLGLRIRCLILDEGHTAKNEHSATWQALQSIDAQYTFVVSGTILANRWSDGYGAVSFLKNHPFTSRTAFQRAFARKDLDSTITNPSLSKENRYIKFLMGAVLARPATLLDLKGIELHDEEFWILNIETTGLLLTLVEKFYNALKRAKMETLTTSVKGGTALSNAVMYATMAQLLAAHECLLSRKDLERLAALREEATRNMDKFIEMFSQHEPTSKEFYGLVMGYVEKHLLATGKVPVKKKSKRDNSIETTESDSGSDAEYDPGRDGDATNESDDEDGDYTAGGDSEDRNFTYESTSIDPRRRHKFLDRVRDMTEEELHSPRIDCLLGKIRNITTAYRGEKILIFSRFLKFHDLAARAIEAEFRGAVSVMRFDGTVKGNLRAGCIHQFNKTTRPTAMLITAGCGGAGLNLSAASHIIMVEPWWRNSDEKQAFGRAYRLGQERVVHVWRLFGFDAIIDTAMRTLNSKKAVVNDRIMGKLQWIDGEMPQIPPQYSGGIGER